MDESSEVVEDEDTPSRSVERLKNSVLSTELTAS
jgi:hypothetical protein